MPAVGLDIFTISDLSERQKFNGKAFSQVTAVSFLQIFSCCSYSVFISCYQVSRKENREVVDDFIRGCKSTTELSILTTVCSPRSVFPPISSPFSSSHVSHTSQKLAPVHDHFRPLYTRFMRHDLSLIHI